MNVLILAPGAFGAEGGVATVTCDLVNALSKTANRIDILVRHQEHSVSTSHPIVQQGPFVSVFSYVFAALSQALRFKPQVVICTHLNLSPLGWFLAKVMGVRFVIQLHGVEVWERPTFLQTQSLCAADLLVCVSRDTRKRLLRNLKLENEKVIVLNNTFTAPIRSGDRDAIRKKFGWSDKKVLLTVGRLSSSERYKGHDKVIEALPELCAHYPELLYVVAGSGDDKTRLEKLAISLGVSDRVMFLGRVEAENLEDLYRSADLFVMLSTAEGFGVVYLEAMSLGTPAVGLNVAGARDALEELGTMLEYRTSLTEQLLETIRGNPKLPEPTLLHKRFGFQTYEARVNLLMEQLIN